MSALRSTCVHVAVVTALLAALIAPAPTMAQSITIDDFSTNQAAAVPRTAQHAVTASDRRTVFHTKFTVKLRKIRRTISDHPVCAAWRMT